MSEIARQLADAEEEILKLRKALGTQGKRTRNSGARWERQAKKFIAELTGHSDWRRADGGEKQWNGDLIPCVGKEGPVDRIDANKWYVECKFRKKISRADVEKWEREAIELAGKRRWFILVKQDGGPVIVFDSSLPKNKDGYRLARITWLSS